MFDKIYHKVLMFASITVILAITLFGISELYDINKNINQYQYLIDNKSSINNEQLCSIFDCTSIRYNNKQEFYDKGKKVYTTVANVNNIKLFGDIYLDLNNMTINIKNNKRFTYISLTNDKDKELFILIISLPIIFLMIVWLVVIVVLEERNEALLMNAGNEAIMTNKSMIMITENIHHELDTPLEVIDNKIEKIRRIIENYLMDEYDNWLKHQDNDSRERTYNDYTSSEKRKSNKALITLEEDFNFIRSSSEQIYNILEKMKGFKHLRYSNSMQQSSTIIENAFKMVSMSNTNYSHQIDEQLKKYRLNTNKLKNADLLNIMINHIKNSLEADASKVIVLFNKFENGLLYFRIIDNGKGIPKEAQKKIFMANFSTKDNSDGMRGNGMYLNKYIIQSGGGDIELIESSPKGTTIQISVPVLINEQKGK